VRVEANAISIDDVLVVLQKLGCFLEPTHERVAASRS
jgi:hypothetical protein